MGPLEMEILGVLSTSDAIPVAAVQQRLKKAGRPLAYTTVMTVLTRMHEKGLLMRRKEGRGFLYSPAKGAGRATESLLARLKRSLFRDARLQPILSLLEGDDALTVEELRELKALVSKKLEAAEKRS